MLRPTAKPWFHMRCKDEERETPDAKRWMEWAEGVQRRAMYDDRSMFVRATKEGDHDFATFGQASISLDVDIRSARLLYRTWHLRDCAWRENAMGRIDTFVKRWTPDACMLRDTYGERMLHEKVADALKKPKKKY